MLTKRWSSIDNVGWVMSGVKFGAVAVALIASSAWFGCGVAAADDYSGQTYADASKAISGAGKKAVVASRAGDALAQDDCVVANSEQAPWIKGDDFSPVTDTVLLSLNCNAGVATATTPGNSAASPEGRAAIQAAKDKAAKNAASASG